MQLELLDYASKKVNTSLYFEGSFQQLFKLAGDAQA